MLISSRSVCVRGIALLRVTERKAVACGMTQVGFGRGGSGSYLASVSLREEARLGAGSYADGHRAPSAGKSERVRPAAFRCGAAA